MMNKTTKWILWIVILAVVISFPKIFGIYYTNVFVLFAIFALYSLTLNLLLGFTGLLSFGHALFFGGGAYATAIALTRIDGLPLLPAILIGGLTAAVFALITSPLLVRVSGTAFAMLTLAFGQLMYVFCLKFRDITGGEDGVGGFPIPPFHIPGVVSIDMTDPANFYYFALAVLGVSAWILWFFTKTPLGSVMVGIRDNAQRVDYLGFKVPHTKAIIFLISGGFAGIAGAIYALLQDLVSTDGVLTIGTSFMPIITTIVGGIGSFAGPIYGAAILIILDEIITTYTERVELVTGVVFILVIMYAPMGFAGFLGVIKQKWLSRSFARTKMEGAS
ncbi:MAG: branched-chain amino acid ABC transporter permease [Thermodesulfobacteriota bacterium]|nr:branched-chain amino acid ABC transporter permease [Thermodesulfobacteriota bacterium]